ncbi:MAG TPA: hypothetical protein VHF51_20735 [Solirubrobacteraceae bacterium]|nr:hypothetical protein [Solirubrobacteraceae bacterium]
MSVPSAPWRSDIDAVLWWHRAPAGGVLPPELGARVALPVTLGGLISYRRGPVGPYREVFGAPTMLGGGAALAHVAFMAVDSAASVAGGRANWALPKELARFDGEPGRPGRVTVRGDAWALTVTTRARRRAVPARGRLACAQVWPDGSAREFTVRLRGRTRAGSVELEHTAQSPLAARLAPGRHPAVLVSGVQVAGPARPRAR